MSSPVGRTKDGKTILRVHVQPRSARNCCRGIHADALKVAITAPPVDGKANQEVVDYLAELLDVRRRDIELVSGATSRKKVFWVTTLSSATVLEKIDAALQTEW